MSTLFNLAFLTIILVMQPGTVSSNFLSPIFGDACKEDVCGKGNCRASNDTSFGFVCECEAGWKQARSENDTDFKFLPCVIPNCTLNYSCGQAPAPAPETGKRANLSIFDPCHWTDCGGGSCNKTSLFTHRCECKEGYYNLLNVTAFPCFKECAIGMDCSKLGFGVMNKSTSPSSPNLADNSSNQASFVPRNEFAWSIITATTLALVMVK
ncbi:vitamin K-dependent S-like [Olea europaea subsp. europaea]|uniref:Vitamin K-dependent S-like n=1 Tax=Olea europaea subsp. europaea TaxID=158383 RepID=A0A8S0SPQ9_OLEEU|nr:vitamin K-dependent S-like [Olea europaea subsp. europaea]